MNRLDKMVVFHPLRPEQLEQILEIELGMVQQRVLDTGRGQFLFRVTPGARRFLLEEGTDMKYGARHLKRAIEKYVVYPLANLLATEQVRFGRAQYGDHRCPGAAARQPRTRTRHDEVVPPDNKERPAKRGRALFILPWICVYWARRMLFTAPPARFPCDFDIPASSK